MSCLSELEEKYSSYFPGPNSDESDAQHFHSPVWFRGQSSESWSLTTTLERYCLQHSTEAGNTDLLVQDYANYVWLSLPEYFTYSKRENLENFLGLLDVKTWHDLIKINGSYGLLVELRHFGFPSPLLDWTSSLYVAAFFAFRHASATESVSIFAFKEYAGHGKGGWAARPAIHGQNPYILTTDRHHIQQAKYTICSKKTANGEAFAPHDIAFDESSKDQDIILKFILPGTLKREVLDKLQTMNINDYTLFRNAEGLCQHLAWKYLDDKFRK